ncbi:AAA family ATPase [Cytophagaceae bacterium DM2B3-1]|uniref:AAA family ATPase n=1 Tax=Xanthocytophaga flava TaxID=3048013 RepID=A0ABT7CKB5_9BACT|nr:AAA family ATPase [Xanthocytophaga flavus]MDJ1494190.1 AAA family ATPase [Xanthocytophaga flavus]
MDTQVKNSILKLLIEKRDNLKLSDAATARQIGVSPATISQIVNSKWDLISDEMWRKVANWCGYTPDWQLAETGNFKRIVSAAKRAKKLSETLCISYEPGTGKSFALKQVANNTENVVYLECEEHYKRKDFLQKLLAAMGVQTFGTVTEMVDSIVEELLKVNKPLVILDEFDKLEDPVMKLFKSIWNKTEGNCGFILAGAPYLRNRLEKGVKKNKQSYVEMWSRMGREYIELNPTSVKDIAAICQANGIVESDEVSEIIRRSDARDLRQVKREIGTFKLEKIAMERKGGVAV